MAAAQRYSYLSSNPSIPTALWAWAHQLVIALNTRDAKLSAVPIGASVTWRGPAAYTGGDFLLEDGSSVSMSSYPGLFAAIGYTYGGAGANFNLPNSGVTTYIRAQ